MVFGPIFSCIHLTPAGHLSHRHLCQRLSSEVVNSLNGFLWVAHLVFEPQIEIPIIETAVSKCPSPGKAASPFLSPVLSHGDRVEMVSKRRGECCHHAAVGGNNLNRMSVRLNHHRIGKSLKEMFWVVEMMGCFEYPALSC